VTDLARTTIKAPKKSLLIFRGALLGILLGVCISVVPICGIRKSTEPVLSEPAQAIFFLEFILASAITGSALLPKFILGDPLLQQFPETLNKYKRMFRQLLMPVAALVFLLLYFAACGLCQRVDMGVIHGSTLSIQICRYSGLLIATAGLIIQAYALFSSIRTSTNEESGNGYVSSPILKLRHPCFFATLVVLTGIPLVMGTWYPLFAVPGIFIVMKWIVAEQERILIEKYGDLYEQYQTNTRRLIPNLY
jgi:protein-S-isoprenylcysteine O-methyltransferase Ste14